VHGIRTIFEDALHLICHTMAMATDVFLLGTGQSDALVALKKFS
jgi:hypothetical protein